MKFHSTVCKNCGAKNTIREKIICSFKNPSPIVILKCSKCNKSWNRVLNK
jgi:hydrogenase maturation factor HypF (carbamoyltransferase family)